MARTPKYRRHSTRDKAFVEFHGRRIYFPGPYKSRESLTAYTKFLRESVPLPVLAIPRQLTVELLTLAFLRHAEHAYPAGNRSEFANFKASVKHLLTIDRNTAANSYGPKRLIALQNHLAA